MLSASLEEDFKTVQVTVDIEKASAELRHKYKISIEDSIIAATAQNLKATCLSDDPHFQIKEIKHQMDLKPTPIS